MLQEIKVAKQETLEDVKQSVDAIKKDVTSISTGYDIKNKFDTSLGFYTVSYYNQSMILAGDYIIAFSDGKNATGSDRIKAYNEYYVVVSIYDTKTNVVMKQYIPYDSSSYNSSGNLLKMYRFHELVNSNQWKYVYDETTDEVTMWFFGWHYSGTSNYPYGFTMAKFKVSELINDNFIDNLVVGYKGIGTASSSDKSKYKFDAQHCIYIPSRDKVIVNYLYSTTNTILVFDCSDLSNITYKGVYSATSSATDYVTHNALYPIRYWYDGTNAYMEYIWNISGGTSSQNVASTTVTIYKASFLIDIDNPSSSTTTVKRANYSSVIKIPSISYGIIESMNTNLWYKGYEYAIYGAVLVKVSDWCVVSEPIVYFPFSPKCWTIKDDILVVYGLDENNYLIKYEYDMRTMNPKMNILPEAQAYRMYTELYY